jgi:hypothetical protein
MKRDSEREVAIFTEALKVSVSERDSLLERMCGGDEDLRRRMQAILSAHDRSGDFLEETAISVALASLLRKMARHPKQGGRRKAGSSFQDRRRKRKGK